MRGLDKSRETTAHPASARRATTGGTAADRRPAHRRIARPPARLRPATFRGRLTLAISLVFLAALGASFCIQTLIVNGMFAYATTVVAGQRSTVDDLPTGGIGIGSSGEGDAATDGYTEVRAGSSADSSDGGVSRQESSSRSDSADTTGADSGGSSDGHRDGTDEDGGYSGVRWGRDGSYTVDGPYGTVWTQDTMVDALRISAAIVFVVFGAASILVIWLVTSRMSRRLRSISEQAAALDPADLGARIDVGGHDDRDEATQLGDAINGMLDRIQAASQAERRFVSNASHELRTPIAAVETNLDAPLSQGRFPADVEPSVRRALAANRRGAELVQALLTLSRLQSRAYDTNAGTGEPIILSESVRRMADDIAEAAARRGITVDVRDDGGTAPVPVDAGLFGLAVGNLLRNAVVHNVDGGAITVDVVSSTDENRDENAPSIMIANTTDEAIPDDMDALRQPFHRGEHSRISAEPGVGLGLSIATAACEAMDAALELSRPDAHTFRAEIRFKV